MCLKAKTFSLYLLVGPYFHSKAVKKIKLKGNLSVTISISMVKAAIFLTYVVLILWKHLGGNSQNFLSELVRFFVTFRCFYNTIILGK